MKRLIPFLISTLFPFLVYGNTKEAMIIEVRKKIRLHDSEKIYSDYFIKGGTAVGLEQGIIVPVVRRVPVHDPFDNASVGDFFVKVADIEIIQSDIKKSVGRLVTIDRRESRPMLTYDAIMIGDRLDLSKLKRKTSYIEEASLKSEATRLPASVSLKPSQANLSKVQSKRLP